SRPLRARQRERDRVRGPRGDRGLRVLPLAGRGARARARLRRGARVGRRPGGAAEVGRVRPLGGRRIAAGGLMDIATRVLRIGVVGVGRIGRMHADLLARRIPGATVTRVHDAHSESARDVAELLGVVAVSDVEELLTASDVDAVAICTSTDTHADLIVAAAEAGKAIFCEKPVSLDLETVD